jgi:hypothetical protein
MISTWASLADIAARVRATASILFVKLDKMKHGGKDCGCACQRRQSLTPKKILSPSTTGPPLCRDGKIGFVR